MHSRSNFPSFWNFFEKFQKFYPKQRKNSLQSQDFMLKYRRFFNRAIIFKGDLATVPNIKSAKKRVLVTEKKTAENKAIKSALKTAIKKFCAAVDSGDKETATALYPETVSAIDSAVSKGILHKNNANNKKAKLAKKFATLAA